MRVFTTKLFRRFARDNQIADNALCSAVRELSMGLVHASLGGNVFKHRIARKNQGKSSGFRTIIFFKIKDKAFFAYGFAKNVQETVDREDLAGLKDLARELLGYDDKRINLSLKSGELSEICHEAIP